MASTSSQSSLARFAHNIYGSLGTSERPSMRGPEPQLRSRHSKKLTYTFDREVTCISQLRHPLGRLSSAFYDPASYVPSHHVIIGGRNYLKLLALDSEQSEVVADVNLIEAKSQSRLHSASKLVHVNTIKCNGDLVACGLTSGNVNVYQVAGNGRAKLAYRLDDHKRGVNSLDFVEQDQLLFSGSQDGTVKLWDLRSFQSRPVVKLSASQHSDSVRSCQYSPHSRVRSKMSILSAHDSGALCKFDLRYPSSSHSSTSLPERKWTFHTGPALSLHIHPEMEYVLTGGRDRKICAWNYSESAASSAPEVVMSTYGPVMKIRWNETANVDNHAGIDYDGERPSSPLFNYDFACSYLNDDPSITVYNLSRRFVPKEIVTTLSHKPFQNFIWARGSPSSRKLWTITKSNMFVAYDLTSLNGLQSNIIRPYDSLPPVAMAWGSGYSNLSLAAQESADYDLSVAQDYESVDDYNDSVRDSVLDAANSPGKALSNSQSFISMKSPSSFSMKDRPALLRSATQFSQSKSNSHRPISAEVHGVRPGLTRNPSQSTEDSMSSGLTIPQSRKGDFPSDRPDKNFDRLDSKEFVTISPYLVNISVQLPLGDDAVFLALANDYLTGVPDAFSLAFVCQINARVAASVQRFRECQVWRLISVALEQEESKNSYVSEPCHEMTVTSPEEAPAKLSHSPVNISRSPEGTNSISSELGNFVGSYNSDSTSTTNYGAPRDGASANLLSSSKDSKRSVYSNRASLSMTLHERRNSFTSPTLSRKSSMHTSLSEKNKTTEISHAAAPSSANTNNSRKSTMRGPTEDFFISESDHGETRDERPKLAASPYSTSATSRDLDNENLNFFNNAAASYSSPGYLGSSRERMSSSSKESFNPSNQSLHSKNSTGKHKVINGTIDHNLDRVDEQSTHSQDGRNLSKLTKALSQIQTEVKIEQRYPWHALNIIQKSIEYAISQGDVVMSATLILLFYDHYEAVFSQSVLSREHCLECIGHYIETLQRQGLFTVAVQVIKDAPSSLKYDLSQFFCNDVDMRFYCCWCQKLLSNEVSKAKYNGQGDNFGYWYCEECSRRQSNCVYCNEPCRGLAVVESLKCGHSGHFGCLQEWHFEANTDLCPAGCEV